MLPFTAEVFFSFTGQYNASTWPAPLLGWLCCLAAAGVTFRAKFPNGRVIGWLLALIWAWIGIVFHQIYFAALFFAAPLFAVLFVLQAGLFAWSGLVRRRSFRFQTGLVGGAGLGLLAFALFCWPAIDWLASGDWQSARLAGTAPAPTAIFTLGILLLAEGRSPLHLAIVPSLWSLLAGAGAWVLMLPEAISLPLAGIGGFALLLWKNRRADRASRNP